MHFLSRFSFMQLLTIQLSFNLSRLYFQFVYCWQMSKPGIMKPIARSVYERFDKHTRTRKQLCLKFISALTDKQDLCNSWRSKFCKQGWYQASPSNGRSHSKRNANIHSEWWYSLLQNTRVHRGCAHTHTHTHTRTHKHTLSYSRDLIKNRWIGRDTHL